MIDSVHLSDEEIVLLKQHFRKSQTALIRKRAQTLLSFHHGKRLKAKLSTTLKPIHLINLPPYAPDHNPQEHVWKYGKDKLSNNQRSSLEDTVTAFISIVAGRNYNYKF